MARPVGTGHVLAVSLLAAALEDSEAFSVIADSWKATAVTPDGPYPYRPTIAFMPNVATAEKLKDAFLAIGVTKLRKLRSTS